MHGPTLTSTCIAGTAHNSPAAARCAPVPAADAATGRAPAAAGALLHTAVLSSPTWRCCCWPSTLSCLLCCLFEHCLLAGHDAHAGGALGRCRGHAECQRVLLQLLLLLRRGRRARARSRICCCCCTWPLRRMLSKDAAAAAATAVRTPARRHRPCANSRTCCGSSTSSSRLRRCAWPAAAASATQLRRAGLRAAAEAVRGPGAADWAAPAAGRQQGLAVSSVRTCCC